MRRRAVAPPGVEGFALASREAKGTAPPKPTSRGSTPGATKSTGPGPGATESRGKWPGKAPATPIGAGPSAGCGLPGASPAAGGALQSGSACGAGARAAADHARLCGSFCEGASVMKLCHSAPGAGA